MIHTAKQLKDKVKNMSGGNSEVAQALIRTYFMERFLERVSVSEYRNNFILKGGMLVASIVGVDMRATMDIDTTVKALPLNEKDARAIIERIGELQLEDGVNFKITSVKEIMEEFDYPGIRMMIEANLERMRQPFKIDISTDDAITPGAVEYKYKLMFEDRSISVLSYNLETLLAEKMQTILARGLANTRMRDFYDAYTAGFLMNVMTNLSNIDFNLYCGTQAQKKMVFAIKDIYSLSGMLVDQNHCLAVTTIEDSSLSTELYYKLKLLCSKETLLIRRTSIPEMIRTYEYEHSLFARNSSCLLGHFTEHFLPTDLHNELLDKYGSFIGKTYRPVLQKMHSLVSQILAVTPIRALIYASAFTDFTVTGELDFYGYRIQLSPEQRLHFFKHMKHLHEISNALQIKILPNGLLSDYQHIPRPTLFFADEFSYLRFRRNTPYYNICIPNKISLNRIFSAFYDTVWEFESCIAPDAYLTHAIHSVEILQSDASGDVHN